MLANAGIKAAIRSKEEALAEKLDISVERIERTLMAIAFGDVTRLFNSDGSPLLPHQIPETLRHLFSGYEIDPATLEKGERHTIKTRSTADQLKAIDMLGRRHAIFRSTSDLNVTGMLTMTSKQKAERLAALIAKARAAEVGKT